MKCTCNHQSIAVCPVFYKTHRTDCEEWSKHCEDTPKNKLRGPNADAPWTCSQEAVQLEEYERDGARWEDVGPPDKPIYKRNLGAPGCHAVGPAQVFSVFGKQ
ncbi:hypothetical protein KJ359_008741 [Pestalotiopsis sp. 9143b]|nr:hypothetical protein KJ359_008741 [Pestalotiopsis sp. 9143b]